MSPRPAVPWESLARSVLCSPHWNQGIRLAAATKRVSKAIALQQPRVAERGRPRSWVKEQIKACSLSHAGSSRRANGTSPACTPSPSCLANRALNHTSVVCLKAASTSSQHVRQNRPGCTAPSDRKGNKTQLAMLN